MKYKLLSILLVVIMLIISSGSALAQETTPPSGSGFSQADFLNHDGTFNSIIQFENLPGPILPSQKREMTLAEQQFPSWQWSALDSNPAGSNSPFNGSLVDAIAIIGTDVYVGGSFTNVAGIEAADYVAKWDGASWSALGSNSMGNGSLNGEVYSIAVMGNDLYIGGDFTNVNNNGTILGAADHIAKWNGSGWSALGHNGAGNGSLNGSVMGIAVSGTVVYAGGFFQNVNNKGTELTTADYVAKFDGANWTSLGSNGASNGSLNGTVYDLAANGSNLYVGGNFMNVSNGGNVLGAADYIARWDGMNWSALGGNGAGDGSLNAVVYTVATNGGDVYAGGWFYNVNNNGISLPKGDYIAKFDGTDWSALGDDGGSGGAIRGVINDIAVDGNDVYVGGRFGNAGVSPAADCVTRWDGTNWWSLGDDGYGDGSIQNDVLALVVSNNTVYVGGAFPYVNNRGTLLWNAGSLAKYSFIPTFSDVPGSHWAGQYIERLYAAGITGGCGVNPLQYCPEGTVTRAQMAVFLERGIHGSSYAPPAVGGTTGFGDVLTTHWAGAWIKKLAADGITGGCGAGIYCPEAPVTRAQMAVFLLRSKYGSSYAPPVVVGSTGFTDVDPAYWAGAWIKQLVTEGITAGCGTGTYCPEQSVTRAQMAVFLVRTFNLP